MSPFNRSISLHAFDYDRLLKVHPDLCQQYMHEVVRLYDEEGLTPLPVTEVPAGEVASAFGTMARREHIGKIVVRMAGERVTAPVTSLPKLALAPDATYLVTGGLSGFGLATARWLTGLGARHLLLVSRRGVASTEAEEAVEQLRSQGVEVCVLKADVAQRDQVREFLATARDQLPPLRGVFHAAAVFDDALLADMPVARFMAATAPKADGAWHLHTETEADQLDLFVLFSSIASHWGGSAVGPYSASNEFLNGLARYRRARKLPAISVNWGAVADTGIAVRHGQVGESLTRHGFVGVASGRLLDELGNVLRTNPVQVTIADIRWDRWTQANPHLAGLPRYSPLIPAAAAAAVERRVLA